MAKLIDLSHTMRPGMPAYPGLPEPRFATWFTHEESAARGAYSPGTTFQIATYELSGNTGTYVDSPYHRYPDGVDFAGLPLERLANVPGVAVDAPDDGAIEPDVFEGVEASGKAVLVRTGWAVRWGGTDYFRSGPYLTADACHFLVAAGVWLVGIDAANIDDMGDASRPAHSILLRAGVPVVEHLRGLGALPSGGFRFFATPPAIEGGTSFPVRAFAIVDAG
jgi:kynurenine formamidase